MAQPQGVLETNKQKFRFESTNRNKICFGCVSVCFVKPKTNQNNPKFSENCLGWSSVCFGSIETSKLSVSIQKRNNRNKRFVSYSAETSFQFQLFRIETSFEGHPRPRVSLTSFRLLHSIVFSFRHGFLIILQPFRNN